jgi:formate hydrogenlyase transcriptional activator
MSLRNSQQMNLHVKNETGTDAPLDEIVGRSAALLHVIRQIEAVAPTDSTVLITGETGTGKELLARSIHKMSLRSGRAFVSVDCAALASMLNCSGQFNLESGVCPLAKQFWGARFESACTGTIFLDQISELPPDAQVALLSVLEEREFERGDCAHSAWTNVRIVAAANRNIENEIDNGHFRPDLFYRLNVFPIELPPLRARREDIGTLVEYFLKIHACRMRKNIPSVDERTMELFESYDWPGNIRELQNIVERSVIATGGEILSIDEAWFVQRTSELSARTESLYASTVLSGEDRQVNDAALAKCREGMLGRSGDGEIPEAASGTQEGEGSTFNTPKGRFRYLN